jgi:hypothetical protein
VGLLVVPVSIIEECSLESGVVECRCGEESSLTAYDNTRREWGGT